MPIDEYSVVADVFRAVPQCRKTSNMAQCWSEFVDYETSRRFVDVKQGESRAALRRVEITLRNMSDAPKGVRRRHSQTLANIAEEKQPLELLQAAVKWARETKAIATARTGDSTDVGDGQIVTKPRRERRI